MWPGPEALVMFPWLAHKGQTMGLENEHVKVKVPQLLVEKKKSHLIYSLGKHVLNEFMVSIASKVLFNGARCSFCKQWSYLE